MPHPKVLLTGGTGFVGAHVAELLHARGFPVRALVRRSSDTRLLRSLDIDLKAGDIEDENSLEGVLDGVEVVVHLAAATRARNERAYQRVNAAGTDTLLRAVLAGKPRPRRFVYVSSLAAVGPSVHGRGVTAQSEPRPLTAYGRSKLAGETLCRAASADVEVVILRAAAVYGPRDRDLYQFFRMASRGILPMPNGGPRPLQLIHAADLAEAIVRSADAANAAGVYHIAEAQQYAWEEVARMVARAVGRRARVVRVPSTLINLAATVSELLSNTAGQATIFSRDKARELLAPGWLCETEAARRDFGFEARIALPEGLSATARWYRENGWL